MPSEQSQGSSGSYSGICQTLQPVLVQSCDTLVNSDGSLTSEGAHAMHCIRNGVLLAGGAAMLGVPLSIVLKGLSILSSLLVSKNRDALFKHRFFIAHLIDLTR